MQAVFSWLHSEVNPSLGSQGRNIHEIARTVTYMTHAKYCKISQVKFKCTTKWKERGVKKPKKQQTQTF